MISDQQYRAGAANVVAAAQRELDFIVERITVIDRTLDYAGFDEVLAMEREALVRRQRSLEECIGIWQRVAGELEVIEEE